MILVGLNTLVANLHMAAEIDAAVNILEATGAVWTSGHLLAILNRRAEEWAMLPMHLPSHEVAAAAKSAHYSQCHRWLALGSCMHPPGTCLFAHDADFKGRADLVPNCNLPQDTQGHRTRPHCFYKHTSRNTNTVNCTTIGYSVIDLRYNVIDSTRSPKRAIVI